MKELKIDPELRDLLPPLADDEYKQLEKNIVDNGFDRNFPIMEWHGFIVDGHNRYSICRKHNIDYTIGTLAYKTKEEVMRWMLDIQLGRRNLTPIQKIAATEKYRPIYEKQARENLKLSGGDKKSDDYKKSTLTNLSKAIFGLLTLASIWTQDTRNSYFVMVSYPSTWTELELLLIVCSPSKWTETTFNFRFNFRM